MHSELCKVLLLGSSHVDTLESIQTEMLNWPPNTQVLLIPLVHECTYCRASLLPGCLGQRSMGKRCLMDSLTFCRALCSRWKCVAMCLSLTHNQAEKVELGCPPKQDLYLAFSHVLSKCAAGPSSMFFGTMGLFLLPDYCALRSAPRSWFEWLFRLICVLSLLEGSLCGTLSWICCRRWGPVFAFAVLLPFLFSRALCRLF